MWGIIGTYRKTWAKSLWVVLGCFYHKDRAEETASYLFARFEHENIFAFTFEKKHIAFTLNVWTLVHSYNP